MMCQYFVLCCPLWVRGEHVQKAMTEGIKSTKHRLFDLSITTLTLLTSVNRQLKTHRSYDSFFAS